MESELELAKPGLDVGVFTNRLDEMRSFYEGTLGLPYEELLKLGGGVHQHRLGLRGSVLKLNHARDRLEEARSCLRRLIVSGPGTAERRVERDPDGLEVAVVPPGDEGVDRIGVLWASREPRRLGALLRDGFGAAPDGPRRWRIGSTALLLVEDAAATHDGPLRRRGFRYLTVQVRDVRAAHARLLDVGWSEGSPPTRLGEVAMVSFVRDPDGVWVEVSQRASLTGPLPDVTAPG